MAALVVDNGGISRCVPSCRTKLLSIMDGMDQNGSIPFARRRFRLWYMQCWFYWYCTSRCVPSSFRQASDARHHGRYEPEGQLCVEMVINILVVAQRQFPLILTVQKTTVIPQLQFMDKVIDDTVVRVVQVLPGRSHARCVQRLVPVVQTA